MRHLAGWAALALVIGACQQVPEVRSLPVPGGGAVLHGRYGGTLTERGQLVDARASNDGRLVYMLEAVSGHALISELDAVSGVRRRQQSLAVPSPSALGVAPDGVLVVAGPSGSAGVDPASLHIVRRLPAAYRISTDGSRLLGERANDFRQPARWSTLTGERVPTITLSVEQLQHPLTTPSHDAEWVALIVGRTLLNLSSGEQVSLSGHPTACSAAVGALLRVEAVEQTRDGFLLAESDGSFHQFDRPAVT